MANKIAQITVGDIKVIHLDANPQTDTIGYDADKGSLAVFQNGANSPLLFIKQSAKGGLATAWTRFARLEEVHQVTGNIYSSALPALIGSLIGSTNLDVAMIRNSVAQIELLEDGGDYRDSKISLLEGLEIREHIVNNSESFGLSYGITTSKNLLVFAQASIFAGSDFVSLGTNPIMDGYSDAFSYELKRAKSFKKVFSTASETLTICPIEVNLVTGNMKKMRVTVVGRHSADPAVTNFMLVKELAVRVNPANDEHFLLFQQDVVTYNQDGVPRNFSMQFDAVTKKILQAVMSGHDQVADTEIQFYVEEIGFELTV